jgi:hypothetical protein
LASNLTTIGLVFDTEASFDDLMQRLASSANERLASDPGDYAIWRSRTGAEVWFHVTGTREPDGQLQDNEIIGFTPFFEGTSDIDIEINASFQRPGENPFEGAFKAWVAPGPGNGVGVHPIVFDCVDFAAHRNRELPIRCHARLTAFARHLTAYRDEADYYARQTEDLNRGARAFIPLGLFQAAPRGDTADAARAVNHAPGATPPETTAPSSNALLTGTVIEHQIMTDEDSGAEFHWLLVDSLGATFDVVADLSVVAGTIVEGGIVEVGGVMFGRLID